jgi:tight adherence protein B
MAGILALLLAVIVLGLAGYALWRLGVAEKEALTDRTELDLLEGRADRWIVWFDRWIRGTGAGRRMARRIDRAGLSWRVAEVLIGVVLISLITFLLLLTVVSWWVSLFAAIASGWLSLKYLDRREGQRREAFIGQLPEIARVLSNATSAGLALRSAIRMVADDMAEPAATELRYLSDELDVGTSISDALNGLHERLPSRELSLLTRTLIIQARAGGAVVTALQEMSETLEVRKDVRREVHTILAGSVFTSWVVVIMGVGSVLVINLIAPGTLDRMTHSLVGQIVLAVAVGLYAVGFVLIRRTTRIEV